MNFDGSDWSTCHPEERQAATAASALATGALLLVTHTADCCLMTAWLLGVCRTYTHAYYA